ncbi:NAD dependent epimerase/dehydratase family [Seminavis robusta]|uniref:NAD dependent epimerase/dehydratase family n=1 Tax=Seminavis robusta TaxID=568900 RepID=A0A9N8HIG2_9STRA|nr:NAD dependent epimerase/dehydratase family [Seminavis robusta]|eukprot:Sro622_g176910.1 NAD dependent epimerase/dehydratase family (174) ;mRNA; f:14186-14707
MLNPKDSRILHISSEMHKMCGGLFFGSKSIVDKYCPPNPKKGSASADYALSKACQILMATQLNHARKIRAFAIEPGLVRTQIGRHAPAQWALELEYLLLGPFFLRTVDQGCSSTLFCALAPMEVLNGPGNDGNKETPFYYANCQPKKPKAVCLDAEEAQRLQDLYKKCWKDFL